jgi:2,3-diketo-5-methylthiopentyl-1-phosphate enolase
MEPVSLPEQAFEGDYIIASYYYESKPGQDVYKKAKSFAIGQTLGTWLPVPGISEEMKEAYGGRLVSIYDIPPAELAVEPPCSQAHVIQIAFPDKNFPPNFPMLLTTLLGNDVSTSAQVKLIDIKFSKNYIKSFQGPRMGIDGIYEYLAIKRRPIVLNMIKPCIGYSPEVGAELFYSTAMGGVDFIKDDELLSDTDYSPTLKRVEAYVKASQKAYSATGHLTRYCPNVTDRPDRIVEIAKKAQDAGAGALLINFVAAGLSSLQALSEESSIRIPIIAHYASSGTLTESLNSGLSSHLLLGKLARMAGADACLFSSPYSTYPFLKSSYRKIADAQILTFYSLKPTMPVIGGGVHPNSALKIVKDLGKEIMLGVGGAIFGHPHGPTKGAEAMMAAVKALGEGKDLKELAGSKGYESLKVSLSLWH